MNRNGSAWARGTIGLDLAWSVVVARRRVAGDDASDVERATRLGLFGLGGDRLFVLVELGVVDEREEVLVELLGDLDRDGDDHHPVEPDARHGDAEQLADHVVPERLVLGVGTCAASGHARSGGRRLRARGRR